MNKLAYVGIGLVLLTTTSCARVAKEPLFAGNPEAHYINAHCGDGAVSLQGNAPAVTGAVAGKLNSFTLVVVGEFTDEVLIAAINKPCGLEETIQSIFDANVAP